MIDTKICICYGSIALFQSMLHNVFLLFHVETFVSIYKIDKSSFWIGETIFLLWNSFNDPLFGWMSDRGYLKQGAASNEAAIVMSRLNALQRFGPLFAASFLLFWISWTWPSLQFVVCLCLYDGFLTMIDLHHSALLADLSVAADMRTRLNSYSSMFCAVGSISVFLSYVAWNKEDLSMFRTFCIVLVVISVAGFYISTNLLKKAYMSKVPGHSSVVHQSKPSKDQHEDQKADLLKFIKQLSKHSNFHWFAIMNIIQVFHCHFNSNFFPLFLEHLLGDDVSQTVCTLLLGISFVAPHINNLYFLDLCRHYGTYYVISFLFFLKLALSIIMYAMGSNHLILMCVFIASNRVFTEGTCKLLSLVISDLVDEDYVLHRRQQAVSALMFGTAALLSKPGQTLAPLIGTWMLSAQTGHDVFESGNSEYGSTHLSSHNLSQSERHLYREGVFQLLVGVPIVCAILQLLVWAKFNLHTSRLRWIKHVREGGKYGNV